MIVHSECKKLEMYGGDTDSVSFKLKGYDFTSADRVLFTVKNKKGQKIIRKLYQVEDNTVVVNFTNSDTEDLPGGEYSWDIRIFFNAQFDESGNLIEENGVKTPGSPYVLQIHNTVGDVRDGDST